MDALERLSYNCAHAEQDGALGSPVARRAGAVFLASEDDERHAFCFVLHRSIVHRHPLLRRIMDRVAALDTRNHLVLDANVGEGAAHHYLVIAASRAVLVKVLWPHLVITQIFSGRA